MLKIRNKARKVVVRFDGNEQTGGKTILTGEFVIKRSEFGIGGGVWNEGDVVGEEVSIKVTLSLAPGTTGRAASVPR